MVEKVRIVDGEEKKVCERCDGERFLLLPPTLEQLSFCDWQVVCAECKELTAMALNKDYF